MSEATVPVDCPVPNPYVKTHILPDILLADGLTGAAQTDAFLGDLSGATDLLAQLSGQYEAYKDGADVQPIIRSLGCDACKLADVCPVPVALERSVDRIASMVELEKLVDSSESGDPIARIWLEDATTLLAGEYPDTTEDVVTFKLLGKISENGIGVEEAADGRKIFTMRDGPTREDGKQRDVAIIDTSGDVEEITKNNDRSGRIVRAEVSTLMQLIQAGGVKETLGNYKTAAPGQRTADKEVIYKTHDVGPGGYRVFFSVFYEDNRTWLLISGASNHDDQETYLTRGKPVKLDVGEFVNEIKSAE